MEMSPQKRVRVRQGAILGLVVGVFIFIFFFLVAGKVFYLIFIPLACLMGAAVQYVKDDTTDDDD
jgi:hypothetical protein